ncbi:nicotinate-nucleotide adenylyltransferase [Pelagicoccus sp. SDUM812003]|uniref:nicotinate-nucleotide adenylyltransferase n=1 Tax=Pelagicoccus sp. SDUM812003 TaxID=3041267 RepID=UPI002810D78B|nr:nicotinate-nucleotide adenylyltransferase [Pelagicoccus sp. SDUM812003]
MVAKRIGIIGGSFDPIHIGHMIIAQDACEQFDLDRVLFIPARQAPLKAADSCATPEQRLAMTQAATREDSRFEVSDIEFKLGAISYSVATAEALKHERPSDALFWILGADQLAQLHHWRDIGRLAELVSFIAFERPGSTAGANNDLPPHTEILRAKARAIDISSSEIRRRLKTGLETKYFLPAPVFDYIKTRNLYRQRDNTE